jgi:hypothetical protein
MVTVERVSWDRSELSSRSWKWVDRDMFEVVLLNCLGAGILSGRDKVA